MILSMKKGFEIPKEDNFYFQSPRGEGSWIFVLDGGFSTGSWPDVSCSSSLVAFSSYYREISAGTVVVKVTDLNCVGIQQHPE